jgi:Raf kinase inhibitor-like YbhB/YbcL family protein
MDLTRPYPPNPYDRLPAVPGFVVTSQDVTDGETMADRHSQAGGNLSPHLAWSQFPAQTKSFAVNCFDPDAPTPAGYWHWTLVNLPPTWTSLPRGAGSAPLAADLTAAGVRQLANDGGGIGFTGAAPPVGDHTHRYIFAVHALDIPSLDLSPTTTATAASFQMLFHSLARATLTGLYQR